jgi:hypothetical protein
LMVANMGIEYSIDRTRNVIFETWTGMITSEMLASYWKVYLADEEVMRCRRTIVDMRRCEIRFNGTQLAALVRSVVLPKLGNLTWKTAIVVEAPTQFGTARQYGAFAETYSKDSIFDDPERALEWLVKA